MADAPFLVYLAAYLSGGVALLGWMALRDIDQMRQTFWAVLLWPLVLLLFPAIAFHDWLKRRGWHVDIERQPDQSPFGFRRRMDGVGWAVRCLWLELQVWKFTQEQK